MFKHILVAVDFAHSSDRALDIAAQMASESGAQLTLVAAYEVPAMAYAGAEVVATDLVTPSEDAARAQMDDLVAEVRKRWPRVDAYVRQARPAVGVLATAREVAADLIVLGTHARHGVERILLGSVAESVLRDSPVPVLVVRSTPST
jgi:nucleotide-binding universal stress UspA family protein